VPTTTTVSKPNLTRERFRVKAFTVIDSIIYELKERVFESGNKGSLRDCKPMPLWKVSAFSMLA
jgi:hypothetical protein